MSFQKVLLLGRLGKDPETKYTQQQLAIASFSLATNERKKDATGNWVDHTEWHNIVTFGKTAENCGKFLKKGREVFVEGRLRTRKWQDKEGKDRYTTEILADTVRFVGGGKGEAAATGFEGGAVETFSTSEEASAGKSLVSSLPSADAVASGGGQVPFDDDDIPF